MFDESEERPESPRIRRLKELVAELQLMLDAPEDGPAPEESAEDGGEKPALEIAVMADEKPKF